MRKMILGFGDGKITLVTQMRGVSFSVGDRVVVKCHGDVESLFISL